MDLNFEDSFDVFKQFNEKQTEVNNETRSYTSGKDYTYVKTQCQAAMGFVGLEFDQVDQIKNLIEEVTGDYNRRVIDYLESALGRLSQLKFCSLPIRSELEECIAAVHEQNRSLREYMSQLEDYVRLVNDTEDSIVEQLSNIEYDCALPANIPICEINTSKQVTVADGSAITLDVDAGEVDGAEDDSNIVLDIFQGALDIIGLVPGIGEPADAINAAIYLARGDKLNAALSASACIPFIGDFATGGKFVNKGVKAVKTVDKVVDIGKEVTKAEDVAKTVEAVKDGVEVGNKSKKVVKETEKVTEAASKTPTSKYGHLEDPKNVGPGKDFTASQKKKILEENSKMNGGVVKSDQSGTITVKSSKSQKGVTPPKNEAQVDHIIPKDKGGANSYKNAQVLTREENRKKSNK